MKKVFTIGLLIISNLINSQSFSRIIDDEFSFKANNQSIVIWKVKIIDSTNYYSSEETKDEKYRPSPEIVEYSRLSKKWEGSIPSDYLHEKYYDEDRMWKISGNSTIFEKTYLLEIKPKKEGYFFESLFLKNTSNTRIKYECYKYIMPYLEIPVFRKIVPENNKLYNYGTIEVTINQPNQNLFVRLVNDDTEKESLLNYVKESYPKVYNVYKDKISEDDLKFYFMARGDHKTEIKAKTFLHYWTGFYDEGINGQLGSRIIINSKKNGQSPKTYLTFNEIDLPLNFNIVYNSDWKKGELDSPYGLILGNSADNKYFFYTTANGKSGIEGTSNGSNEVSKISNENATTPGKLNKKNDYRIEVRNKKATYYINNIEIGTFDLNADLSKACFVGFMVKDKQNVVFDALEIIEE